VSVSDPPPAQVIDRVLHKQVDLGIIATVGIEQLREVYSAAFHVMSARELPLIAGLPPRMADAPDVVRIADLHRETWLLPARALRVKGLLDSFYGLWDQLTLPPPTVRLVGTLQTAIPLVVAGLGVTMIPEPMRTMAHPQLVTRPFADPIPPMNTAVIWARSHQPSPAMELLLEELARL
jgi:DNA-binding transcriptional LysR family regulator